MSWESGSGSAGWLWLRVSHAVAGQLLAGTVVIWRHYLGEKTLVQAQPHSCGREPSFLAGCWPKTSGPHPVGLSKAAWVPLQHGSRLPTEQVMRDQNGSCSTTCNLILGVTFIILAAFKLLYAPTLGGSQGGGYTRCKYQEARFMEANLECLPELCVCMCIWKAES